MEAVQSSEAEVNEAQHKEVVVVVSREPARVNNDKVKANSTIREVVEVVEAEDSVGEITTSHKEIEIPPLQFVLAGP